MPSPAQLLSGMQPFIQVLDDACIAMQVGCSTTNTGFVSGNLKLTQYPPDV